MNLLWTPEQDQILLDVASSLEKPINWKNTTPLLKVFPNFPSRTPKQCRVRWTYLLDLNSSKVDWTEKQQDLLLSKHLEVGNRWSELSRYFPLRTQNALKNQYHSVFKRALRRLNKLIYIFKRNRVRPITAAIVLKLLATCDYKFNPNNQFPESLVTAACELRSVLALFYRSCDDRKLNEERVNKFLEAINVFRKELRMKSANNKKLKMLMRRKQRLAAFLENVKQEVGPKIQAHMETNQSSTSSILIHPQPCFDHKFIESPIQSMRPIHPMQHMHPAMTQIFFPNNPFMHMMGLVEEEIQHFPMGPPYFDPYFNRMFAMANEMPMTLENSMMFQNDIKTEEGINQPIGVNFNCAVDNVVKKEEPQ